MRAFGDRKLPLKHRQIASPIKWCAFVLNNGLGSPACFRVTAGYRSAIASPEALGNSLRFLRVWWI
jgi:hypothetical protein